MSVSGGECRLLDRPTYAVYGKTQYDQDWIDGAIEGGVAGCGWARPLPRPPELDAQGVLVPSRVIPGAKPAPVKKTLTQRVKAVFTRKPTPLPAPAPNRLAPAVSTEDVEPPPAVRVDPVLEFLGRRS